MYLQTELQVEMVKHFRRMIARQDVTQGVNHVTKRTRLEEGCVRLAFFGSQGTSQEEQEVLT